MLDPELLTYLVCPETHQDIVEANESEVTRLNGLIREGKIQTVAGKTVDESIEGALIRSDGLVAYPVRDEIPIMLVAEGLDLRGAGTAAEVQEHG